ncbi:MAG TPA: hypothetical protein VMI54_15300 [Polyangiaceae bacterium]|nr:hypothetical protein [Polyangiaceae bacterium]
MRWVLVWLGLGVCGVPFACGGRLHEQDDASPAGGGSSATGDSGQNDRGTLGDPGDATCACDATGPACALWLSSQCSGTATCPPSLHELLQAADWGMPTSYTLRVTYTVCSDGTRSFTSEGFEYAETFEFGADGRLLYEDNQAVGGAVCGAPEGGSAAPSTAGVSCETCEVLRQGGLERAGSSAGGAGASAGGAGATGAAGEGAATDQFGTAYCLVDDQGQLVMPN